MKIKTIQKGKFPVIGFVKDPTVLGKREGKDLLHMGMVGTGWSRTVSSQIRKQLDTVVSPKSKLSKPLKKTGATWVEPNSMRTSNTAISRQKVCYGPVRLRVFSKTNLCCCEAFVRF